MSMILSRVDCSESRDEIISSVQNQKFQVSKRKEKEREKRNKDVRKPYHWRMLSGPKKITAQKTKKNRKRKRKKQQKQNANSTGRSYSAPKPVWELLLVRQLQIILGEKLFGPQARLRITPIAWFEPATSMTSLALVARPRLPVDHLEYASLINISCRYGEFSNTGLGGGRVRKFVQMRV